ncbi:uroporphyrinogen-III synthase [Candidatus Mycobacterium methanotrophicum]|uniref:Uroporphyrinogen-III synthase n=1 Tax=Candidatus Mycobacterium methanotrophicum TaxID=2943498 RepID=A0ABY4QS64_9MYCO|nr:uroporphyrinogen-III synthase [Candidatus Mycobacterium methanotrophicum]UQX13511.1 uroporphyrinogen-III synthase [Candidatus Mycobacterium methanotrophicum]
MTSPEASSLTGFTVAITASRRVGEFATMLCRRGANVVTAAAIQMVPLVDDTRLRAATDDVIATPPDVLIATTGIGFRGWVEAAHGWGVAEALLDALSGARIISRGPKAAGALRAAGLREEWSPVSESSEEVLAHLSADDLDGRRVAVQLHGAVDAWDPMPGFRDTLSERGAAVVAVPVYRWEPPADLAALDDLVEKVALGSVDAVTFTSAPAVASFLMRAEELRLSESVARALTTTVTPFCVGPVTARPLEQVRVPSVLPGRMRLGALARIVADELPRRQPDLAVAGHTLGVHATCAVVDGQVRDLSPNSLTLLKLLAREPGAVVSRDVLLEALGGDDPHVVEAAVARLRSALGAKELIATAVKRGYRLAVEYMPDEDLGSGN